MSAYLESYRPTLWSKPWDLTLYPVFLPITQSTIKLSEGPLRTPGTTEKANLSPSDTQSTKSAKTPFQELVYPTTQSTAHRTPE